MVKLRTQAPPLWLALLIAGALSCATNKGAPSQVVVDDAAAHGPTIPVKDVEPEPETLPPDALKPGSPIEVLDPRTPLQIAQAACRRVDGRWACPAIKQPTLLGASSSSITSPVLTVTNWYLDPQNGSGCAADTNSGTSATCGATGVGPLLTWAQIAIRYGTIYPIIPYGQSVTVHLLTAQNAGVDPIFFYPNMSGGGQAVFVGTPVTVNASFTAGTVTAPNVSAGGTLLTVASMPAGTAAGQLVYNATHGPSYAFIDSFATGTASMQQPLAASGLTTPGTAAPTAVNTWTTGDTLSTFTLPLANLKVWRPRGGDLTSSSGTSASVGWVQGVTIVDPSGGTGASEYALIADGTASQIISLCTIQPRLHGGDLAGRGNAAAVYGSNLLGAGNFVGAGQIDFVGGGLLNGISGTGGLAIFSGSVVHGTIGAIGAGTVLNVASTANTFADGTWNATGLLTIGGVTYGSFAVTASAGATVYRSAGTSWATEMPTSGALKFGTSTTGTSFNTTTGAFTTGVSLTLANLDSNNGSLQDPLTGARFSLGQ
jgi:hypothetical protein